MEKAVGCKSQFSFCCAQSGHNHILLLIGAKAGTIYLMKSVVTNLGHTKPIGALKATEPLLRILSNMTFQRYRFKDYYAERR